jgi:hypothetical protein
MTNPHTQDWFVAVINDIPTDDSDDELLDIIERAAAQMRAIAEGEE